MTKIYVDCIKNDKWTNKPAKGRIIQNQIILLQISSELRHDTLSISNKVDTASNLHHANTSVTCPCNVKPLGLHFNIEKLGCTKVYMLFLFLFQDIDHGYSLEPPLG